MQAGFADRLAAAQAQLAQDPRLGPAVQRVGACRLEPAWTRAPWETLVRSIAFQQLHGRAAEAILRRMTGLYGERFPTAAELAATEPEALRAVGFSGSKVTAVLGVAQAAAAGHLPDRAAAEAMDDDALIARLTELRGVGRWTVEMLLIFTLGRLDVWPVDDFGVRNGYRVLLGQDDMPTKKQLAAAGEAWRPWRSVAAWYLWRVSETKTP